MFFQLPVGLLAAIAWVALVDAIPADPTITAAAVLPRQVAADWIGWVKDPDAGTWTSQSCDAGGTWYRSGSYGQCCPDTATACPAPTACVGGSQIYPLEEASTTLTIACTSNYNNATYSICNTALIFESFGDPHPITDIVCGDKSQAWSFYRQVPASISENPTSTASPDSKKSSSGSKAWIAGVVVGPLIGIAIVAGVIFFLIRRKKNKQNNAQQTGGIAMGPPPGVQQYSDAKPQLTTNTSYGQAPPVVDNSYNQQTYNQGYAQPTSPAPQYQQPYSVPTSPPPQFAQSAYVAQDGKNGYAGQQPQQIPQQQQPVVQQHVQHPNAAELGGLSSPAGGGFTAELSSDTRRT